MAMDKSCRISGRQTIEGVRKEGAIGINGGGGVLQHTRTQSTAIL